MKKIGFIGMGNMAKALAAGFIASGKIEKSHIYAFAPNQEKLAKNAADLGFIPCDNVCKVVSGCDTVFMACKPYQIEGVLKEAGGLLKGKALISIAISWDFEKYSEYLDTSRDVRLQYIMPNTPAMVGEGVFLLEERNSLEAAERTELIDLLNSMGTVTELPGHLMSAGSAISGCGPAFIDLVMEAMADAAVKHGIKRQEAYAIVAQMVAGSGKLMAETGKHPGELKDAVCSPGGTTIRGVAALEHGGVRAAFMDAVDAAAGKL